jgi:hypothetical protein
VGESQFRRLEKKLSTLPTLCLQCMLRMTKGSASGVSTRRPKARGMTRSVQLSLIYNVMEHSLLPTLAGTAQLRNIKESYRIKVTHCNFHGVVIVTEPVVE